MAEVPAPNTSTMSSPFVPLTITVSAWPSPAVPPIVPARSMLTSVTSVPLRSLTVDGVGAAERVELDALDVVQVHDDVADVAGEPHPLAVGRDVEDLVARSRR